MEQVLNLLDEHREIVKKELKQNLHNIKDDAIAKARTYTDLVTEELKDQLDVKFEEMMGFFSSTREFFKNSTCLQLTNTQQGNRFGLPIL
jgi:energy-converting hydrogenase A subunit M